MIVRRDQGLPTVSVAVLSHKRRHLLGRVLWALSQLDYPAFEIVVVGDLHGIEDFDLPEFLATQVKYVHCARANICLSRNLALEASSGEVVAFIDDDAVPEPDWLREMAKAFAFPKVGGAGGLVRGADGFKVEWRGGIFDRSGRETDMPMKDDIRVFDADSQVYGNEFVGTLGANSAFRREALLSVGGFDESFRYYLDETDMMLRLAEAGWDAAVVLTAEVHHLREENSARDGLRTPRNLFEIAASKAYFCQRHMRDGDVSDCLAAFRKERVEELDPYIRAGLLRRRDKERLVSQLDKGLTDGRRRVQRLPMTESYAGSPFRAFRPVARQPLSIAVVAGWNPMQVMELKRVARRLADAGFVVSFLRYMSGQHPRTVTFADGLWLHTGGTWRLDQRWQGRRVIGRRARARAEIDRISARRGVDIVLSTSALTDRVAHRQKLPGLARPLYASLARRSGQGLDGYLAEITAALEAPGGPPLSGANKQDVPQSGLNTAVEATTIPG